MEEEFNIDEVEIGDSVDFKIKTNRATSAVKEVDYVRRLVKINFFEDPDKAIDRVNKWIKFEDLYIIKKAIK